MNIEQRKLHGMRVLLVTERPFLHPVDGSTQIYLTWLRVLQELGCAVSVLSFSRFSQPWTDDDVARLQAETQSCLVLDGYSSRGAAVTATVASAAWRAVAGRRYLPLAAERPTSSGRGARINAFLQAGQFDAVVVHKLSTTVLVGQRLLRAMPGIRVLDVHDNFPRRERLSYRIFFSLWRRYGPLVRDKLRPRDMLGLASWAGERRLLAEEAALLSCFDHATFYAGAEAEAYAAAGLPRSRIAVLPMPCEAPRKSQGSEAPRPYQLGLIAADNLLNIEALDFLRRDVLPRLKSRRLKLLVAGSIGKFARATMPPDSVEVLGWIEDLSVFYDQTELVLAPLLSGTGVSVKTVEAALYGAAIVSTSIGARGVNLVPGRDIVIADGGSAYAAAIERVLDDPPLRAAMRRNAADAARRHHSRAAFADGVAALLRQPQVHAA